MSLRALLNRWFRFSRRESRGVVALSVLLALLLLAPFGFKWWHHRSAERYTETRAEGLREMPANSDSIIEINHADSLTLIGLNGIGPAMAGRILDYRRALGGFWNLRQLLEVKGIGPAVYTNISPLLRADSSLIQPVYINKVSLEELTRHPYMTRAAAEAIVERREKKGPFTAVSQIQDEELTDAYTYTRIFPYLSVQ